MKKVPLSQGGFAVVSDKDYKKVRKHAWFRITHRGRYTYAATYLAPKSSQTLMHRLILNPPQQLVVDHRDGNGLNNTRKNIRICSKAENCRNSSVGTNNKLGVKGVDLHRGKYRAQIRFSGEKIYLGSFATQSQAKQAYAKAAKKLHGAFARTT